MTTDFPNRAEPDKVALADTLQYLTFSLGKDSFALGIASIKEILRNVRFATVPMMPTHVRGVINLRGAVVPVIDLCVWLKLDAEQSRKNSSVIVIEVEDEGDKLDIGVLVDSVSEVVDIARQHIEPTPDFGTPVQPNFIEGMARINVGYTILLNVRNTFSLARLSALSNHPMLEYE